jgi:hypothetical protein
MSASIQKMRKVPFADLIEFVAVAEYRSFTRAATQLGVSMTLIVWKHDLFVSKRKTVINL